MQKRASTTPPVTHYQSNAKSFAFNIAVQWVMLTYVWAGVRRRGGRMSDLTGGRWRSWRQFAIDVAITIPFWLVWTGTAKGMWWILGPPHSRGANYSFPPRGALDVSLWVAVSITAGFCEEVIFRGYLQKQFTALTSSAAAAIAMQAIVFGAAHLYQGYKPIVVISVLGLLYGILAWRRGNLLPGILSHAWSDIFEGYLKHVL